jgi:tetratricopeptide (TPR) repeat protein
MNMKSINIILSILLASVALSGCAYDRSNKMVKGYKGSAWVDPGKPTIPEEDVVEVTTLEKVAEQAKKQHGLMHVHRYGEGYDILLTLDAGDSDVKFIMELPQSEKEKAGNDASELSAEEAAATAHDQANGEITEQEVKKLRKVETMTKYILNAQSLFYKKQYWDALDETNAALDLVPDSAQALALKGSIYYKMGLIPEARSSWEEALRIDPELTQVQSSLSRLP